MTILMLIPDFGKGGAERVFSQLSASLGTHYRVIDCVFNRDERREYPSGNETASLDVPAGKNGFLKFVNFLLRVIRLRKIKKKYAVDMTISHLEGADYVNLLSRLNDKVVLTVHGTKFHDKNITGILGWLRLNILMPSLYRRATHIVAVSRGIRNELVSSLRVPATKVSVINNFFDVDLITAMASEGLSPSESSFFGAHDVLIATGRLAPQKNHRLLIRLMPHLVRKSPGIKLVILGSGAELPALVAEANEMGLSVQSDEGPFRSDCDIFFPGYRMNPFAYLHAAKLFVLPSLWEGYPLALCEALICGVPVIAHDCPTGPRELLAPNLGDDVRVTRVAFAPCGVLMPYSHHADAEVIENWVDAILGLLHDEAARHEFILAGRARAMAFRREHILSKWVQLIEQLR